MKIGVAMLIVVLSMVGYLGLTPYLTLMSLKQAVQSQDGEAIAEKVEFSSVRESLKEQINAKITGEALSSGDQDLASSASALLGATFAASFVDNVVDTFIKPSSLISLFARGKDETSTLDSIEEFNNVGINDATLRYEGVNQFSVSFEGEDGDIKVILSRRGLVWKITEIRLPQW